MVSLKDSKGLSPIKFSFKFLKLKNVPTLFWSSPKALTFRPSGVSIFFLIIGLILFGLGEALLIAAGLGVSPWTVLAQGITNITGWTIGFATFVTSFLVLICWIPLKQTPGVGTILNAVIIALVLDFLLPFLPTFDKPILNFANETALTGSRGVTNKVNVLGLKYHFVINSQKLKNNRPQIQSGLEGHSSLSQQFLLIFLSKCLR